jgi:hypothetical protein
MKLNFSKWLEQSTLGTEFVDESKIDSVYDKAKLSVKLVQLYDEGRSANLKDPPDKRKLLLNINAILPLNSGVYGLYVSSENKKVLGRDVINKMRLMFPKDVMLNQKLQTLPNFIIKKYIPDIDERQIQPSDTIHVNITKTVSELGDSVESIIEIASTIVHEATHELELQYYGKTDETGPQAEERKFVAWAVKNWVTISKRIPALGPLGAPTGIQV